ncbi:MAG: hypothetical protein WC661_20080 [Opitutaceae bacterium]|jgi:hypothetical protein
MKSFVRFFLTLVFSSVCALTTFGSAADVVRIEEVVRKVLLISGQYAGKDLVLTAPAPLTDKSGKYFAPYGADGELNAWGKKALEANVGSLAGEKAGGMAVSAAGSVIPGAGLLSPFAKKKSKELGAKAAVGGSDFIKKTSDYSFNSLEDYAVFLHAKFAGQPTYKQALASTIAVYPELETTLEPAIKAAYAQAEAAKEKAAAEKAAAEKVTTTPASAAQS